MSFPEFCFRSWGSVNWRSTCNVRGFARDGHGGGLTKESPLAANFAIKGGPFLSFPCAHKHSHASGGWSGPRGPDPAVDRVGIETQLVDPH